MLLPILIGAILAAVFAIALEQVQNDKHPFDVGLIALVAGVLINGLVVYFGMPWFTHVLWDGYPLVIGISLIIGALSPLPVIYYDGENRKSDSTLLGGFIFVVLLVVWAIVAGQFTPPGAICDDGNKDKMAQMISIEDEPAGTTLHTNDIARLIKVTPSMALNSAKSAIGGTNNVGSYLEVNRAYLQEVAGHPYFIVDLKVSDWNAYNSKGGTIPGYVVVDALDASKTPEFKTGYKIVYGPDAPWDKDLDRHAYEYLLGTGLQVQDLDGLEVDDKWNPVYTGTLVKQSIGFQGYTVVGVLTVDAQSGKINQYAFGAQPKWVNRVFPLDLIKTQASWWGKYIDHDDCAITGKAGMRKVDRVNDVFGYDGLKYQVTFTSDNNKDDSISDFITVDTLTGKSYRSRSITGSTIEKVEQQMEEASRRITSVGLDAQECELQIILGREVWYCIFVTKAANEKSAGSLGGYGFLQKKITSDTTKIIVESTLTDAYNKLRQQIATEAKDNPDLAQQTQTVQIVGKIDRKATITDSNKQYVVFTLTGPAVPAKVVFRADANNVVAALMQPGDQVTVTAISILLDTYTDVIAITNQTVPVNIK